MSDKSSILITLAGQDYTILPFTVGQLEELHVGVVLPPGTDERENMRAFWKRNIDILSTALSSEHKHMTADHIRSLRLGSIDAVTESVNAILEFAGIFKKKEDAKPEAAQGEAQAAA